VIELVSGRWRLSRHLLVGLLGSVAAGIWFGTAGWVPMLVWTWACRPRPGRRQCFVIGHVTAVQLGPWRTVIEGGRERWEVFHDELDRIRLAALRRTLKDRCSARDRSQHVEPV